MPLKIAEAMEGAGFWGKDALREFSNRKCVMRPGTLRSDQHVVLQRHHQRSPNTFLSEVMSAKDGFARPCGGNLGSLPHVSWLQVLLLGTTMTDPMVAAKPAEIC